MKLYNYKFLGLVAFMACTNIGCKKFVDMTSPTIVSVTDYYKSEADITAAVNGMYSRLRNYYSNFYVVAELPSDNTMGNGYTITLAPIDNLAWIPSNPNITSNWAMSYSTIARANIVLDRIDGVAMSDKLKTQYIGEAKFIRALMYFNLVQFFGNIQLVLHEIKTEEDAYSYPQVSPQVVYDQIVKDLSDAISSLPAVYPAEKRGKATKGAAQGLLGKVLVTNKKFDQAVPVLREVVNSGMYTLLTEYDKLFDVKNKNNTEIIFDVEYYGNGFGEGSNFSILFAPFGSGLDITSGGTPAGNHEGTPDLNNAFELNDLRKASSISHYAAGNVYYTRKFLDKPIATNEGKNNWPVLRLADVLLLYAEALNERDMTDDALVPLNVVRNRAGLPPIAGLNKDELYTAIHHERRVELCFEGDRWYQLLRTGTMFDTMTAFKEKYLTSGAYRAYEYEVTPNKILFPIPFSETSLNPNLIQNDGY